MSELTSTESRTPLLMSVQAGMAGGATIAVILRFYTRLRITRNVGLDDWLMLVALVRTRGHYSLKRSHFLPIVHSCTALTTCGSQSDLLMGSQWPRTSICTLRNGKTYRHTRSSGYHEGNYVRVVRSIVYHRCVLFRQASNCNTSVTGHDCHQEIPVHTTRLGRGQC